MSPAVMKTKEGPLMLHVDDNLVLCPSTWLHDTLAPLIKSRFQATVEIAYRVGDQISFLKLVHTLTETGVKIAISDQYAKSMAKILEIVQISDWYRALCFGRPARHCTQCSEAFFSDVTPDCFVPLTQYMLATSSYALHLEPGEPGTSMLHGCVSAGSDLIECYADADCCGSKADRKSIGSAMQWFTLPLGPNDRCPSRRWRVNGMPAYPDAAMHYSFVRSGSLSQANLQ